MSQKKPQFCHLCGQKILGRYVIYESGLVVCDNCEHTLPHCDRCGIPSPKLNQVRDKRVCASCLKEMPVCGCCHIPVSGTYTLIGDSPIPYCQSCITTRPRCDICTVPLNEQGKIITGRGGETRRCATCLQTAVSSEAVAQQLYRETHALLKRELGFEIAPLPRLHLVERTMLVALHSRAGQLASSKNNNDTGPQHLLGFYQRVDADQDIYIEHYLPGNLYRAVAAHELAHAWQSMNSPHGQPPTIVEGFAEWVAYTTLLALGRQQEAARLTRRNDLYGEGLQYFIALERQQGRTGVLRRAKQQG